MSEINDACFNTTRTSTKDNEEEKLLASLHASIEDQSAYEDNVIRQATDQFAPSLTLTNPGFPALNAIAPSFPSNRIARDNDDYYNPADLPHIHKVLGKVRREIREQNDMNDNNDLLYLKEQMLLTFLSKVACFDNADLPVRELEEREAEQKRALKLQQNQKYNTTKTSARKRPPSAITGLGFEICGSPRAGTTRVATRIPMMKRKRIQVDNEEIVEDFQQETEELKSLLRKLRLERQQRKKERRKQWISTSDTGSGQEVELDDKVSQLDDGIPSELEASSDGGKEDGIEGSASITENETESKQESTILSTPNKAVSRSENSSNKFEPIICPLCNREIKIICESEVDAILAQHMDFCQRRSRRPVRTSAARAKRTLLGSTEFHESEENTGEYDEYFMQNQGSESESELTQHVPIPPVGPSSLKTKKQISVRGIKTSSKERRTLRSRDDFDEWVYEDRVDQWIENGIGCMKIMKERDENEELPGEEIYPGGLVIPAWVNNSLFGYQRHGLRWLWDLHYEHGVGGLIGDEMGLGKTVQTAAYLGSLAASRKMKSALIVAPATVLQHWLTELKTWAPGLRRILIHQSGDTEGESRSITNKLLRSLANWLKEARKNRVYEPIDEQDIEMTPPHEFCGTGYVIVTTYENVRRNADIYAGHEWTYVILDEAQKIRNPDADITLACKRIRTTHRIAISGTPIQNDLKEFWSLFDFIFPGRLGTLPAFEQEFAGPIRRGGYSNASPMQVQIAYRCAITLRDLIEPFLLRRLKKDIKESKRMPGKTEHVLFCRLSNRQRDMYEAFLKSDEVARVIRGSSQMFAAVTMLRKISNHPDLVCDPDQESFESFLNNNNLKSSTENDSDGESLSEEDSNDNPMDALSLIERSGKLEVLSKILPLWKRQGHRVLIFCQWRKMLNIIQRFVMLQGWKFGRLDGNTNVALRQHLVDSFNTDESYFAMLCTTRTGGVGLNLTGANRIILYDPDWNPSTDQQARERVWRFGQKKDVTIYRLITAGTIEEKIYHRQIFKTALSNKVLQDPKQRRLFSYRDLKDLFTLGADTGSVRSGGDGVTETSKVTRGVGVIDSHTDLGDDASNKDNEVMLKNVMQSKGLAGVFDHHSVENDPSRKTTTGREMEEQAKLVARDALLVLEQSVAARNPFLPTWTGSDDTRPGRFGSSKVGWHGNNKESALDPGPTSSSLLASLKMRNRKAEAADTIVAPNEHTQKYAEILVRLKDFVQQQSPTTEEILMEFSDSVPDSDVAIFRRLLKSVATMEEGRWYLVSDMTEEMQH